MDLSGKAAVVTGGTKGIGFAIAEKLLQNGAKVLVCGRSKSDLRQAVVWLSMHWHVVGDICDVRS